MTADDLLRRTSVRGSARVHPHRPARLELCAGVARRAAPLPGLHRLGGDERQLHLRSGRRVQQSARRDAGGRPAALSRDGGHHRVDRECPHQFCTIRRLARDDLAARLGQRHRRRDALRDGVGIRLPTSPSRSAARADRRRDAPLPTMASQLRVGHRSAVRLTARRRPGRRRASLRGYQRRRRECRGCNVHGTMRRPVRRRSSHLAPRGAPADHMAPTVRADVDGSNFAPVGHATAGLEAISDGGTPSFDRRGHVARAAPTGIVGDVPGASAARAGDGRVRRSPGARRARRLFARRAARKHGRYLGKSPATHSGDCSSDRGGGDGHGAPAAEVRAGRAARGGSTILVTRKRNANTTAAGAVVARDDREGGGGARAPRASAQVGPSLQCVVGAAPHEVIHVPAIGISTTRVRCDDLVAVEAPAGRAASPTSASLTTARCAPARRAAPTPRTTDAPPPAARSPRVPRVVSAPSSAPPRRIAAEAPTVAAGARDRFAPRVLLAAHRRSRRSSSADAASRATFVSPPAASRRRGPRRAATSLRQRRRAPRARRDERLPCRRRWASSLCRRRTCTSRTTLPLDGDGTLCERGGEPAVRVLPRGLAGGCRGGGTRSSKKRRPPWATSNPARVGRRNRERHAAGRGGFRALPASTRPRTVRVERGAARRRAVATGPERELGMSRTQYDPHAGRWKLSRPRLVAGPSPAATERRRPRAQPRALRRRRGQLHCHFGGCGERRFGSVPASV